MSRLYPPGFTAASSSEFPLLGIPSLLAHPSPFSAQTFQCMSGDCRAKFHDKPSLQAHVSDCHGHEMPHMCNLCGKGYMTSSGLNSHLLVHEGKTFMCPVCDCKLSQISAVRRHIKTVHKSSQCLTCNGVFPLEVFNSHVINCSGKT